MDSFDLGLVVNDGVVVRSSVPNPSRIAVWLRQS